MLPQLDSQLQGLKVREAAGVFFVITGNGKNGCIEFVVAKLLKCHSGCDCRKDGDVCGETTGGGGISLDSHKCPQVVGSLTLDSLYCWSKKEKGLICLPSLTGKPGGSFIWTNSLSLLKCLKGATTSKTFNNLGDTGANRTRRSQVGDKPETQNQTYRLWWLSDQTSQEELTHDSMPRGKSWLMAIVALKFFLLSLQTSSRPRWGALWGGVGGYIIFLFLIVPAWGLGKMGTLVWPEEKYKQFPMRHLLSVVRGDVLLPGDDVWWRGGQRLSPCRLRRKKKKDSRLKHGVT